jgi:solute carrier family 25, member 38
VLRLPGLSRAVAAAVLCPITVVKTRMEYRVPSGSAVAASLPVYNNTWHALSSIARQEGAQGLFKGLWPTVLTNAPFSGELKLHSV